MHDLTLTLALLPTVNVGWCGCEEVLEGPLKHVCNDMCNPPLGPGPPAHVLEKCNCCVKKDDSGNCCTSLDEYENCVYTSDEAYTADDGSSNGGSQSSGENKSVGGASAHTNWWLYVVGAATVALVGAGIVMRKRVRCRNYFHVPLLFIYSHALCYFSTIL